jgi:hypothetical protein
MPAVLAIALGHHLPVRAECPVGRHAPACFIGGVVRQVAAQVGV